MRSIQFQLNRHRIRTMESLYARPFPSIVSLTEPQTAEVRAAFIQRFCFNCRHSDDLLDLYLWQRAQATHSFPGPLVIDAQRWSDHLRPADVPGDESTVGFAYQSLYEIHTMPWSDALRAHEMLRAAHMDTWIVSLTGAWAVIEAEEIGGFGVALSRF